MAKNEDIELKEKHIGSSFDDFLKEEGMYDEVVVAATKKALAFKLQNLIKEKNISKVALAKKMHTSRSSLDRLLDPTNTSVTLQSIGKAASVLGKRVVVDIL
ncbi:MAG TPA: helix-turn-helix transcriptional regulator [Thermodesulfobacteriota bacterium]|nr:helix-turn-helix transcriptional regulator [Thermodesulfobacteriota bacterium]